jgi:catechol 2,3-dioxygenase-like lactoylglutathione lyase family enzyme
MQIEHVAIWTRDPERLRSFYETYFDAVAGPRYENPRKQFTSLDGPRRTGDGYYESVIADPDGNRIEITA